MFHVLSVEHETLKDNIYLRKNYREITPARFTKKKNVLKLIYKLSNIYLEGLLHEPFQLPQIYIGEKVAETFPCLCAIYKCLLTYGCYVVLIIKIDMNMFLNIQVFAIIILYQKVIIK